MRTLLLTSAGFNVQDEILKILPKPPSKLKIVHITTASKDEKNKDDVTKDTEIMRNLGFQVTEVDIEGMSERKVRKLLGDKDIVYVQGGNTYWLLKCVRESGFDKVVEELLEKGVIYIGVSAGSYIAGPSIEQASWIHTHNKSGLTDLSAMNLVPFMLIVHYLPKYNNFLQQKISKSKYKFKILNDDQAILVQGNSYKLVGKGPEIKI